MNNKIPIVLGAVAYSPSVLEIWEGFKTFFIEKGVLFDFVLYSNYERQVEALFRDEIDVAWNSPLAWIRSQRIATACNKGIVALAMRDTDCDLTSLIITHKDTGIRHVNELSGKKIAVGAIDSPQATLIPLEVLKREGLEKGKNIEILFNNILTGKHGDHVGGEENAVKALVNGEVDAACVIKPNVQAFLDKGLLLKDQVIILKETPYYDHCNFTALENHRTDELNKFTEVLLSMKFDDPKVRYLLEMEGLKQWKPGRITKYDLLESAVDSLSFYNAHGDIIQKEYLY